MSFKFYFRIKFIDSRENLSLAIDIGLCVKMIIFRIRVLTVFLKTVQKIIFIYVMSRKFTLILANVCNKNKKCT